MIIQRSDQMESRGGAGPMQGRTRQAVEPAVMSGALQDNHKVLKGKRTFLAADCGAENKYGKRCGREQKSGQTRQSPRRKGNDRDGDEGGL